MFCCLINFELMLYVSVNSKCHVGMLPLFYVTFTQTLGCHDTQNVLHKCNHPTKPIRLFLVQSFLGVLSFISFTVPRVQLFLYFVYKSMKYLFVIFEIYTE